jgi:hypothetical protein
MLFHKTLNKDHRIFLDVHRPDQCRYRAGSLAYRAAVEVPARFGKPDLFRVSIGCCAVRDGDYSTIRLWSR